MIERRTFLKVMIGSIAAPYVIRNSGILMPVRAITAAPAQFAYDPRWIELMTGNDSKARTVHLNEEQMDFCRDTGINPREYARNLLKFGLA